jgi:hypothetical protein
MSFSVLYRAINRSQSLILEALEKELEAGSYLLPAIDELTSALGHLMNASDHAFKRDSALITQDIEKANLEAGFQELES